MLPVTAKLITHSHRDRQTNSRHTDGAQRVGLQTDSAQTDSSSCRWAVEGFPKGPALLSYLYAELAEADAKAAPLVRFLFTSALQPYMQHMWSWMYSTAAVQPHFAANNSAGDVSLSLLQDSKMVSLLQ